MAETTKYARTTISVPPELKERMDAVQESVNWSALACRAFEDKLAELVAKQEVRDMQDVITRLRASKRRAEDEHYQAGQKEGRAWAEAEAEAEELERLESWQGDIGRQMGWDRFFHEADGNAYSTAELMVFGMRPEDDGNRYAAEDFWECALGDDKSAADNPQFVKGFIEGALDLWYEVKDKL